MLFKRFSVFRSSKSEFYIHLSVIWDVLLITWTLATGIFPYYYKYLPNVTYYWMAIIGSSGLVASVLLPEILRLFIWNWLGIDSREVTIFIFGGVLDADIKKNKTFEELVVVISGAIINIILAFIMHCSLIIGQQVSFPIEIMAVIEFIRMINIGLVGINFLPLLPFYGGRVMLMLMNRFWENEKSSGFLLSLSSFTGLVLITAGMLLCIKGYFQGGMWWVLLGIFFREGCELIQRKFKIRQYLKEETASSIMTHNPVFLLPHLSIDSFVKQYLYNYHYKIFPVIDDECRVRSVLFSSNVFSVPRQEWQNRTVEEVATVQISEVTISMGADALEIITHMHERDQSRVVVVDKEMHLMGIIVIKDLLRYMSAKMGI